MKNNFSLVLVLVLLSGSVAGQNDIPLFQSTDPLNIRATGSIRSIKKNSNDSTLVTTSFQYEKDSTNWITVPTRMRTRGNFRLRYCYFPPIKLILRRKAVDTTVFKQNKALKLVVPCRTTRDKNTLIRKEYLCYKFCEALSPYYFRTRLANLNLTEVSNQNHPRDYDLLTFFVEDNSEVAKRCNGKIQKGRPLPPEAFDERQAVRDDFIQYMIGNADWSALYQHNTNLLYTNGKYVALCYDFDMSGFVNAYYATENPPDLGTGDPRERVYRGFCKSSDTMQQVRQEFLAKESVIQSLIDKQSSYFGERDMKDMHSYINEFFDILKNDRQFKMKILEGCRTDK